MYNDSLIPMCAKEVCIPKEMTMREKLVYQQARLSAELENVNNAIAALDANPQIDKAFEALSKVNRYLN